MIRAFLVFILVIVVYHAIKAVFLSAVAAYHGSDRPGRLPGEEMVRDPECGTYVVKGRAVARRINGATAHFCSAACADRFAQRPRT